MSYLIDTNIISELVKPTPNPRVVSWVANVPSDTLYLSVLTIGEIRGGIDRLVPGERQERLRNWLEGELREWFGDRVLAIDAVVADRWGRLVAESVRSLPAIDSLLAATALHHDLRLVTRNARDFAFDGLQVVDPWSY